MLRRSDQQLVRRAPGRVGQELHAVRGSDRQGLVFSEEAAERATLDLQLRQLRRCFGRDLAQPDELRVTVRKARPGLSPLVEEDLDVGKAVGPRGRCPLLPGDADRRDFVLRNVGERAQVPRRVDDDLLTVEGRVEIRDDADLPARGVGLPIRRRDSEYLRRGAILSALAERAPLEFLSGLLLEPPSLGAWALRPRRRDDDGPPRDRVLPDLRSGQLLVP